LRQILFLFFFILLFLGCDKPITKTNQVQPTIRDWEAIKSSGKLIALVDNSTTSYFIYRGQPLGFEYELLNWFAEENNLELEIVLVDDLDSVFNQIKKGHGDIIAANLTITKQRQELVNFTEPHLSTRQVLVQKLPENYWQFTADQISSKLIRDPIDLANKNVWVRRNSSFYERLKSLSDEIGNEIDITEADGKLQTEDLIRLVAQGEIDYTIADENVAKTNKKYYPNIDIETAVSFSQNIAWAINKRATNLQTVLNTWITEKKKTNDYHTIYLKYFKARTAYAKKVKSDFGSAKNRISEYDDLIKLNANKFDFDWRLIASVIFQESQYDTSAESWTGAQGLMQLLPQTAAEFGNGSLSDPNFNIYAGTAYLSQMLKHWLPKVTQKEEALKFALASYNVGLGHVLDATRLAEKNGLNANVWNNNVELMLKKKAEKEYYNDEVVYYGYCKGSEPVFYVKQVIERYKHYKNLID